MGNETDGWDAATWEGSRRAQLRRALTLTVRQRLEGLEALSATSRRLADAVNHARVTSTSGESKRTTESRRDEEPSSGS
ncbi:MAG: hypothetical protein WEF86_03530 [Gemmatimonadota bacterium]